MARKCNICLHPKRNIIEEELVAGRESQRVIAARYGISQATVWRHSSKCLAGRVAKAAAKRDARSTDRLLDLGQKWLDRADAGVDKLVEANDYRTLPGMLTAGLKAVETVARLEGRPGFGDGPQVNATVQIALVKLPSLGNGMTSSAPVIDVSPVRGHLASGGVLEGDCNDEGTGGTNCEG